MGYKLKTEIKEELEKAHKEGVILRGGLKKLLQIIEQENRLIGEFKGALAENFVLSGLCRQFEGLPCYWRSGNRAEMHY